METQHCGKNVAKRKRNRGEECVNRSGETVPAVVFKDHECGCPLKCATKHSVSEQQAMFDLYWNSSRDDLPVVMFSKSL